MAWPPAASHATVPILPGTASYPGVGVQVWFCHHAEPLPVPELHPGSRVIQRSGSCRLGAVAEPSHEKTTTVGHRSPGDQGSAVSGSESFRAQREAMMQLLGVENSSPSKSTLRKLSQKQSRRSHVGRALNHGEMEDDLDDVSKLPPLAEVIDVDKAKASPQREPVSHHRRPTPRSTHPCSSPRSAQLYLSGVSLWRPRSLLENWTASFPHCHLCLKLPTTRRPKSPSALTASVLCRRRSVRRSLCSRTSGPSGPPKACACTQRILPPRIVHLIRHGSHYRTGQHSLECQRCHPGSNKCRPGVQIIDETMSILKMNYLVYG